MPDSEHVPSSGRKDANWVSKTGGLPEYINRIAKDLMDKGMSESHAIATAVNTVKKWARGEGGVKPDTRAKAAAALADWERKKVQAHADLSVSGRGSTDRASVSGVTTLDLSTGGRRKRLKANADPRLKDGKKHTAGFKKAVRAQVKAENAKRVEADKVDGGLFDKKGNKHSKEWLDSHAKQQTIKKAEQSGGGKAKWAHGWVPLNDAAKAEIAADPQKYARYRAEQKSTGGKSAKPKKAKGGKKVHVKVNLSEAFARIEQIEDPGLRNEARFRLLDLAVTSSAPAAPSFHMDAVRDAWNKKDREQRRQKMAEREQQRMLGQEPTPVEPDDYRHVAEVWNTHLIVKGDGNSVYKVPYEPHSNGSDFKFGPEQRVKHEYVELSEPTGEVLLATYIDLARPAKPGQRYRHGWIPINPLSAAGSAAIKRAESRKSSTLKKVAGTRRGATGVGSMHAVMEESRRTGKAVPIGSSTIKTPDAPKSAPTRVSLGPGANTNHTKIDENTPMQDLAAIATTTGHPLREDARVEAVRRKNAEMGRDVHGEAPAPTRLSTLSPEDRLSGVHVESHLGHQIQVKRHPTKGGFLQVSIGGVVVDNPIGSTNGDAQKHINAAKGTINDAVARPANYHDGNGRYTLHHSGVMPKAATERTKMDVTPEGGLQVTPPGTHPEKFKPGEKPAVHKFMNTQRLQEIAAYTGLDPEKQQHAVRAVEILQKRGVPTTNNGSLPVKPAQKRAAAERDAIVAAGAPKPDAVHKFMNSERLHQIAKGDNPEHAAKAREILEKRHGKGSAAALGIETSDGKPVVGGKVKESKVTIKKDGSTVHLNGEHIGEVQRGESGWHPRLKGEEGKVSTHATRDEALKALLRKHNERLALGDVAPERGTAEAAAAFRSDASKRAADTTKAVKALSNEELARHISELGRNFPGGSGSYKALRNEADRRSGAADTKITHKTDGRVMLGKTEIGNVYMLPRYQQMPGVGKYRAVDKSGQERKFPTRTEATAWLKERHAGSSKPSPAPGVQTEESAQRVTSALAGGGSVLPKSSSAVPDAHAAIYERFPEFKGKSKAELEAELARGMAMRPNITSTTMRQGFDRKIQALQRLLREDGSVKPGSSNSMAAHTLILERFPEFKGKNVAELTAMANDLTRQANAFSPGSPAHKNAVAKRSVLQRLIASMK